MPYKIERVGVLGAGVMGAGIAAHLTNAGIPVVLLDIVPNKLTPDEEKKGLTLQDQAVRNRLANQGVQTALTASPAAFYTPKNAQLITTGNFEDDWDKLAECDWVVEVVVERLDIKRSVFQKLAATVRPDTIVSSNTSGISINAMAEGLPEDFQRRLLVTHFFNPPRYMKLLELVPNIKTDPALLDFMHEFFEDRLGKGVIFAKDTPNFVGNRIGSYGFMATLKRMAEAGLKIEEVDAILGRASGRPKSAAFRTSDLVGLDTSLHVARNVYDNAPTDEEREMFQPPEWIQQMVAKGWLGDKTRQGFYKKVRDGQSSKILALDPATMEYREQEAEPLADTKLAEAARRSDPKKRLATLVYLDDRAGNFAWNVLTDGLLYTARRLPEIADDILTVDNAMKWGYNWDLGIFEGWDAIDPRKSIARMRQEGRQIPDWVNTFLEKGQGFFYIEQGGRKLYWDFTSESYRPLPENPNRISLAHLKQDKQNILAENDSASLIDLGDGVACLEFHSKMNAIDPDIIGLGMQALHLVNGDERWKGMVISNEADDFSAGANLFVMLMAASSGQWDEIDKGIKAFQDFCMAIKYSPKPVVAAPFGRTLGGGCEVVLAAARVRAYGELYMGLVEVGAGLIPGGGGNKELVIRNAEKMKGFGGPFPPVQKAFETISFAKVSTSVEEARSMALLRKTDKVNLSRERLISDAKGDVLELAQKYQPPTPSIVRVPGEGGELALEQAVDGFVLTRIISQHDAVIAKKLAYVLAGGDALVVQDVPEQHLLDLERAAFLDLCKQPKTQERMQYILMNGKPLRN
jgi:3-hydroxyacyl-CoA dehydrogenase